MSTVKGFERAAFAFCGCLLREKLLTLYEVSTETVCMASMFNLRVHHLRLF